MERAAPRPVGKPRQNQRRCQLDFSRGSTCHQPADRGRLIVANNHCAMEAWQQPVATRPVVPCMAQLTALASLPWACILWVCAHQGMRRLNIDTPSSVAFACMLEFSCSLLSGCVSASQRHI